METTVFWQNIKPSKLPLVTPITRFKTKLKNQAQNQA